MTPPSPASTPCFAVIAGGGTAGHVSPGLAIARAFVARGHDAGSLRWIGSHRGLEARLVPEAGFHLDGLGGRGIRRSLAPRAILANIGAALGLAGAFVKAFVLLRRYRPRVVLVLGGYASLACVVSAAILRIPMVVTEQNARAGASNRIAARFAKACAVPFPGTDLPNAIVTGNPVRDLILDVDRVAQRDEARVALDLPAGAVVVGVFSGSLGSTRINDAIATIAARWKDRADVAIRHVTGTRDFDAIERRRLAEVVADEEGAALCYQVVAYEERVDLLLAAADVMVSRAGGNAVAELAQVGIASVLVPLPIATRDHQTANAAAFVTVGAAVLVPDPELDADRLEAELLALVDDPERMSAMGRAAHTLARPDAADRVAGLLEDHARDR